jgi:hypothetical protein
MGSIRIGGGEFYLHQDELLDHARWLFLDAVRRVEPEVLRSLAAGPYLQSRRGKSMFGPDEESASSTLGEDPLFSVLSSARDAGIDWTTAKWAIETWLLSSEPLNKQHPAVRLVALLLEDWLDEPAAIALSLLQDLARGLAGKIVLDSPVRSGLEKWARRWNLCESWCLVWAIQTMIHWRFATFDPATTPPQWHYPWGKESVEVPALEIYFGDWQFATQHRAGFEAFARQLFERRLKQYCVQVERLATGFQLTPEKRQPEHFAWLARAAVKGERPADIWKSLGPPGVRAGKRTLATRGGLIRRAVEKAISDTASQIGLRFPET